MPKRKRQLHPGFPVVDGLYPMTPTWAIQLPERMNRRFEDGSLVLWRPGLTAWIIVWGNDHAEPASARAAARKHDISPAAFEVEASRRGTTHALSYRLTEQQGDRVVEALYSFTFEEPGHVQMAVYFDDPADLTAARAMHEGVVCTAKG